MKENQLTTDDEVFTVKDFSHLPTAIQKYIESCGYIGTQKMSYLKMEYHNVGFSQGKSGPALKIDYTQYNFISEPCRMAVIEQCSLRPEGQTVKQWLADNGINEKTYYYWQRRIRKEVFGQINRPQPAENPEPASVSFAEIPVIPEQRETTMEASFHADAVIRTGNTTIGLSNSISDRLLDRIMGGLLHAR